MAESNAARVKYTGLWRLLLFEPRNDAEAGVEDAPRYLFRGMMLKLTGP